MKRIIINIFGCADCPRRDVTEYDDDVCTMCSNMRIPEDVDCPDWCPLEDTIVDIMGGKK